MRIITTQEKIDLQNEVVVIQKQMIEVLSKKIASQEKVIKELTRLLDHMEGVANRAIQELERGVGRG